jgi:CO dehydrogenase maturation factor
MSRTAGIGKNCKCKGRNAKAKTPIVHGEFSRMSTIAIAGKGGSGKTTVAGTLARVLARGGREVWAIDADSTPNLAVTLGLSREQAASLVPMPRTILREDTDAAGKRIVSLGVPPAAVIEQHAAATPDAVKLLLMGRIDHAGAG